MSKLSLLCKLALEYFTEHEKPLVIVKFMELQNKAENLFLKFNASE